MHENMNANKKPSNLRRLAVNGEGGGQGLVSAAQTASAVTC